METLERILHTHRSVPRHFIDKSLATSRAVGRVAVRQINGALQGHGTGFMIRSDVMVTCNHVIPNEETARHSQLELDFYELDNGAVSTPFVVALHPETLFLTHEELDVTLVAIDGDATAGDRKPIELGNAAGYIIVGETVNMIHHPGGEPMQFTIRDSVVSNIWDEYLHYTGDTSPGSGGAPIFNDQWELVAVHHASVPRRNAEGKVLAPDGSLWTPGSPNSYEVVAKEGIRLSAILNWIHSTGVDLFPDFAVPSKRVVATDRKHAQRGASIIPQENNIVRDSVFISYAHADQAHEKWKERLLTYLHGIPSIGNYRTWDDSRIRPGDDWLSEIEYALKRARVAILMIGPHFLTSRFILAKELPSILASSENDGLRILPIVTDYAAYTDTPLGKYQTVNDPNAPLESLPRHEQNRILLELAKHVADEFSE